MARNIAARLHISGTLVAQTPLHIGGLGADVDTDLPLARDGAGRYYVPGTSFAGAMRAWCSDVFDKKTVQDVWGYQEGEDGHASWIFVEDAFLPHDSVAAEIRDGVGIDRVLGCAAEYIKYDRAVLPRGTKLPLVMTVDLAVDKVKEKTTREMLAALLAALKNDEVRFGAAQTRGLGRLKLQAAKVLEHAFRRDPGKEPGILALLRGTLPDARLPATTRTRPRLVVTINWKPVGPLMVKAGMDGIGVDTLPLMSDNDGKLAMVLPGSSIKGALRFQAERIVRTVLGRSENPNLEGLHRFLEHTDVPLVEDVFGSPGRDEKTAKEKNKSPHLGRGALGVDDCYANSAIPHDLWKQITLASPEAKPNQNLSEVRQQLQDPRASFTNWTAAFHVAIDRWTGGAADGFLYSVLEPHGVDWEPLRLELDPKRLPGLEWQGLTLLLLVLRDLATGRVPLGFATHRGMGAVAIDRIEFTGKDCCDPFVQLDGKALDKGDLTGLPTDLRNELNAIWKKWAPK